MNQQPSNGDDPDPTQARESLPADFLASFDSSGGVSIKAGLELNHEMNQQSQLHHDTQAGFSSSELKMNQLSARSGNFRVAVQRNTDPGQDQDHQLQILLKKANIQAGKSRLSIGLNEAYATQQQTTQMHNFNQKRFIEYSKNQSAHAIENAKKLIKRRQDASRNDNSSNEGKMSWPNNVPGLAKPQILEKIAGNHMKNSSSVSGWSKTNCKQYELKDDYVGQQTIQVNSARYEIQRKDHFITERESQREMYWNNKTRLRESQESVWSNYNKYGGPSAVRKSANKAANGPQSLSHRTSPHINLESKAQLACAENLNLRKSLFETLDQDIPEPRKPVIESRPFKIPSIVERINSPSVYEQIDTGAASTTVEQILERVRNKFKKRSPSPVIDCSSTIQMKGKSKYQMPSAHTLNESIRMKIKQDKNNQIMTLSKNVDSMASSIMQRDQFEKAKRVASLQINPMEDYVKNFSEVADILNLHSSKHGSQKNRMIAFAAGLKQHTQMLVAKDNMAHTIQNMMKGISIDGTESPKRKAASSRKKTESELQVEKMPSIFNKSLEEETKTIDNISHDLLRRVKYQKIFKSSDLDSVVTDYHTHHSKIQTNKLDPRIKFFQHCSSQMDLVLPILDKIYKKTICLQDYTMSEGHCKGLAHACEFIDSKVVNRILMSNCGVTGDDLALILEGLAKLHDFKSIIYKMNGINTNAINHLEPLFQKRIPHHLQELTIIDCKMSGSLIEQLMMTIRKRSQLKKLALVNILHSDGPFLSVVEYLKESLHLEELNVSWSSVRPIIVKQLIVALKENRLLTCLSLSFIKLLQHQNHHKQLTEKEIADGITEVPLIEENVEAMDCFMEFIKYNPHLIHLDLQSTYLQEPALRFIGRMLTRAQSLRSLHLCNNPGLSQEMVKWLRKRIKAQDYIDPIYIKPYKKPTEVATEKNQMAHTQTTETDDMKWRKIRQGLRLKNMVSSKRMNNLNQPSLIRPALFVDDESVIHNNNVINDGQKLIVTRHLGYKSMIPGVAKWKFITDQREECWHCDLHVLTLFVWTPRIGQLAGSRDEGMIKYYQNKININIDEEFIPESGLDPPKIASQFTDWRYKEMRNVVEFCTENDPYKPNFMERLTKDKIIRKECAPPSNSPMNGHEKKLLVNHVNEYYRKNWPRIILIIMRYQNPLVANVNQISSLSSEMDTDQEIYFHIDWLKPGRYVYAVKHTVGDIAESSVDAMLMKRALTYDLKQRMKKGLSAKSKQQFYVHEMLASFRTEDVPMYCKQRNLKQQTHDLYTKKPVFKEFVEDTPAVLSQCLSHDLKHINLKQVCEGRNDEEQLVVRHLGDNYQLLKNTFTHLQAHSRSYPFVDTYAFRQFFVRGIGIMEDSYYKLSNFDILLAQVSHNHMNQGAAGSHDVMTPIGSINRSQFLELCVRLGKFLYSTGYMYRKGGRHHYANTDYYRDEKYAEVSIHKSLSVFIDQVMTPFHNKIESQFNEFRNIQVHDDSVELMYTMNENAIHALYKLYAQKNHGKNGKPYSADYMTVYECFQLFKDDCPLNIEREIIHEAFTLCKMTIINETDIKAQEQYRVVQYVEFLELIARIAELHFKNSEMQGLMLDKKVGYILDELLPLVEFSRTKQKVSIVEFSDSDDDY